MKSFLYIYIYIYVVIIFFFIFINFFVRFLIFFLIFYLKITIVRLSPISITPKSISLGNTFLIFSLSITGNACIGTNIFSVWLFIRKEVK
jgi:hypothetical protein